MTPDMKPGLYMAIQTLLSSLTRIEENDALRHRLEKVYLDLLEIHLDTPEKNNEARNDKARAV